MMSLVNRNVTPARRKKAMALTGGKCWFCAEAATTVDHLLPIAQGGKNASSNLVPACHRCNQKKQDGTLEEFRAWLAIFYALTSRQQPSDSLYKYFCLGRFYGEAIGKYPKQKKIKHKFSKPSVEISRYPIAEKLMAAMKSEQP